LPGTGARASHGRHVRWRTAFEWPCPGDLLHMDTTRYARFTRPGHALTGVRNRTAAEKRAGVGYQYTHAIIDDHTRLASVELHDDERAGTVTAFTQRAIEWFASHHIRVRRLMTDNAWSYTHNRSLARLLWRPGDPPPGHSPLPTADQRQNRALSPDHGARMGTWGRVRQPRRPPAGLAILARPLQRAASSQRSRRHGSNYSRSEPV
jgi:hypothetical protein